MYVVIKVNCLGSCRELSSKNSSFAFAHNSCWLVPKKQWTHMVDTLSPEKRSWTMSRVRSKNTKPELRVRSLLHRLGFRFRLDGTRFPGNPDIVLRKYKTVIFVNGCFWHQHKDCKKSRTPKSNTEFWQSKLDRNAERDKSNLKAIVSLGWKPLVVWECELRDLKNLAEWLKTEIAND